MKTQYANTLFSSVWSKMSKNQKRLFLIGMCATMAPTTIGCMSSEAKDNNGANLTYSDNTLGDGDDDISQLYIVTVKEADTLGEIAIEYNTTIEKIVELNNILDPNVIQVGQTLKVYGHKTEKIYDVNNNSFANKIGSQGYAKGIDISAVGQSRMDLNAVLNQNDIDFVMVRLGYFISQSKMDVNGDGVDDLFDKYAEACAKNDVPMGVYFWPSLENINSAVTETRTVLNKLEDLKNRYGLRLEMPVCLDLELEKDGGGKVVERLAKADKDAIVALQYMIETLEASGYYVMIYTGNHCLGSSTEYRQLIESLDVDTWIPRYLTANVVNFSDVPNVSNELNYSGSTSIKQYTQTGRVNGYNGNVDLDVCYLDFPKIIKSRGLNGWNEVQVKGLSN